MGWDQCYYLDTVFNRNLSVALKRFYVKVRVLITLNSMQNLRRKSPALVNNQLALSFEADVPVQQADCPWSQVLTRTSAHSATISGR